MHLAPGAFSPAGIDKTRPLSSEHCKPSAQQEEGVSNAARAEQHGPGLAFPQESKQLLLLRIACEYIPAKLKC